MPVAGCIRSTSTTAARDWRKGGNTLAEPKEALSPILAFDPDWIKDPVPWVLRYLDRDFALRVALSRVQLQRTVLDAHAKVLEEMKGLLEKQVRG